MIEAAPFTGDKAVPRGIPISALKLGFWVFSLLVLWVVLYVVPARHAPPRAELYGLGALMAVYVSCVAGPFLLFLLGASLMDYLCLRRNAINLACYRQVGKWRWWPLYVSAVANVAGATVLIILDAVSSLWGGLGDYAILVALILQPAGVFIGFLGSCVAVARRKSSKAAAVGVMFLGGIALLGAAAVLGFAIWGMRAPYEWWSAPHLRP